MSQHPSLRSASKSKQHRSVLKRFERIQLLKDKEEWAEEEDSVFGLPKVKTLKLKTSKGKTAEEKTAEAGVEGAAPEAAAEAKTEGTDKKEK